MQEKGHGMAYKIFQVDNSTETGWFLYSKREMDTWLADAQLDIQNIPIGVKWKVINTGIQGKLSEDKKVQGLVVEVEAKSQWKC